MYKVNLKKINLIDHRKRSSFIRNDGGGKLFNYNESTVRAIDRLMEDSRKVYNTARIVGESPKRCPKLKPIKVPQLAQACIQDTKDKL